MFPTRKISIHSENDSNESKPKKQIFKSPLPFYLFTPSDKLIQQILLRKKDFPFKRKEMCNKLNLTLYQFQKIERKFIGYEMTGILFMMKEYNISKEFEFILHDFLFKNIRFINKD